MRRRRLPPMVTAPARLMRFDVTEWPGLEPLAAAAAWAAARRAWCDENGYNHPRQRERSLPDGPFGDVVDMLSAQREARMLLLPGAAHLLAGEE